MCYTSFKKYFKATSKCFTTEKKLYLHDRFFVSNLNLLTLHVKIIQNSRFYSDFCWDLQVLLVILVWNSSNTSKMQVINKSTKTIQLLHCDLAFEIQIMALTKAHELFAHS